MSRLLAVVRQWLCDHEMYLDDLTPRDAAGMVRCPCHKCGKVLSAECGIALPGRWAGFRKRRAAAGDEGRTLE
jgi:hypothetical protein